MRSLVVTVIIINCAHCTEITVERQQCRRKKCLEAEPTTAHVRDERRSGLRTGKLSGAIILPRG